MSLWSVSFFSIFTAIRTMDPWWLRWWRICLQCMRPGFNPWVRKVPQRREWLPTTVFFPGEFPGQRSLVGYSPWGLREWDTETNAFTFTSLQSYGGWLHFLMFLAVYIMLCFLSWNEISFTQLSLHKYKIKSNFGFLTLI